MIYLLRRVSLGKSYWSAGPGIANSKIPRDNIFGRLPKPRPAHRGTTTPSAPPLTVIWAREITPPDEVKPIEWLLLTTWAVVKDNSIWLSRTFADGLATR